METAARVAPLVEQELVAHVFLPGGGPHAGRAHESLKRIWARCRDLLHVTEPITVAGDPHPGVVTMRESPGREFQVVLRRERDVFNLSLLLASQEPWRRLDGLLDTVIGEGPEVALGVARLYLAKSTDEALRAPATLGSGIAGMLPGAQEHGWWTLPFTTASGLVAWEISPRDEARAERRVAVLAPPGGDRDLSVWTWSDGRPGMPPLARYLMHAAKIRYEMRVRERSVPAGRLCRSIDEGAGRVRELIDAGTRSDGGLAELRADRARAATLIGGLEAMRRTVEIARSNAEAALGADVGGGGMFGDDRTVAGLFEQRIRDDVAYLRSSAEAARQVTEISAETDVRRPAADPAPVFGIVTALPEEFAAMATLIEDSARMNVEGDRANYLVGTLPGLDPPRPHRVVLTLLGDTGNDAAADGCANLSRSFGSVGGVLMVGVAAGVPDLRRPERHVRLGDIVVSTWGIVDYDHVIDTVAEPVLRQPFPRPSRLLAQHANWLSSEEMLGRRPWETWITRAESELPGFARPPAGTDVLRPSDEAGPPVPHPGMDASGHRPGWPKVHYGFIGSADRSLRNARTRDRLARKYNLRAFEMEGKGVGDAGFANGLDRKSVV